MNICEVHEQSRLYPDLVTKNHPCFTNYLLGWNKGANVELERILVAEIIRVSPYDATILDVGCGSGWTGEALHTYKIRLDYVGFDGSKDMVDIAKLKGLDCYVGLVEDTKSYVIPYDMIICSEVLEHIKDDKDIIRLWGRNVPVVISVPIFECVGHLRWFDDMGDVSEYYSDVIDIDSIQKVNSQWIVFTGKTK